MAERYRVSFDWRRHPGGHPSAALRRVAVAAMERLGHATGEVAVMVCDDAEMRSLNRSYRGKDRPTDVLSFPSGDVIDGRRFLGDVAISLDTARRQAADAGIALERELEELLLHAVIHLSGFDHENDEGEMEEREVELRRELLG